MIINILKLFSGFMLFNLSILEKFDKSGMHKIYDQWPSIAKQFFEMDYDKIDLKNLDQIIFTGMGGSGAIGDTLAGISSKTDMHVQVVKGFHIPQTASSSTLVVATSVSGNTLETLTVLRNARKIGCKTIVFTSGGKIQQYCKKEKIECRIVPIFHSPRASFPAYLYAILNVLEQLFNIKKYDLDESIQYLTKTQKQISSYNIKDNPSLDLAKWMPNIPMIYYPMGLQAAAIRFKNSLQENTKIHAIAEDILEACHNGIVAWETKSQVKPILLEGKDDYIKTKQLWNIVKEYFDKNNIDYMEIHSTSGNILTKLINLIYQLDYATIYRSVIQKLDPSPVRSIEFIKNKIK